MSINPLLRASPTRVMGLSSGMDTDSIIQQTLRLHQMKIDNHMRSRKLLEWRQQTHNSIKDEMTKLRQTFLTSLSPSTMMQRGAYNSNVAVLSGKNAGAVTVRTNIDSSLGTLRIGQIVSLAKNENMTTAGTASQARTGFSPSDTLGSINSSATNGFAGGQMTFTDGRAELVIGGSTIEILETDRISDMISKVNSSGAGVRMSYDRLADKFSIEATGSAGLPAMSDNGNILGALGLSGAAAHNPATKAQVYINDRLETFDTNTFDFRGVNITLHNATAAGDEETTVTIRRDATDAFNRIKGFVDTYNTLITRIETLLKERKTSGERSYLPLTDEEKSMMSDKQVEEWEAIARKGLLNNDPGLQSLLNGLHNSLMQTVDAAGIRPIDIGLRPGSFRGGTSGIVIDEARLRAALEEDPDKVAAVFSGTEGNTGLLWRMNSMMGDYLNQSQTHTMQALENSIKRANEQMDRMQQRMYAEEDKLYRQFAAMETALSKLQSQGDWFAAMLGGGK